MYEDYYSRLSTFKFLSHKNYLSGIVTIINPTNLLRLGEIAPNLIGKIPYHNQSGSIGNPKCSLQYQ